MNHVGIWHVTYTKNLELGSTAGVGWLPNTRVGDDVGGMAVGQHCVESCGEVIGMLLVEERQVCFAFYKNWAVVFNRVWLLQVEIIQVIFAGVLWE